MPTPSAHSSRPGVSVVIPTYLGAERLGTCLHSLGLQTLAAESFELVVVHNGPDDGTRHVVAAFAEQFPRVQVRTAYVATAGASLARNIGLALATRDYVTFVDDDDSVAPSFLGALLAHAAPDLVVVGQVGDVAEGTDLPEFDTYIEAALARHAGTVQDLNRVPTTVSFNAAKLVSTSAARAVGYDTSLRSGEDVVFWLRVVLQHRLRLCILDPVEGAVYYRHVRAKSVSRGDLSFGFSIEQRLDVLSALDRIPHHGRRDRESVEVLMRAQIGHMRRFLEAHPDRVQDVLAAVEDRELSSFDRAALLKGMAHDLVIAYAFPPWGDTSAGVMARRVQARGELVDVVYADLSGVRELDPSTDSIVNRQVARRMVVRTGSKPSFSAWRTLTQFCSAALARIEAAELESGAYRSVYSRSMWPASHLAAALYKLDHPATPWTAEFSDPMLIDSQGNRRRGRVANDAVAHRLRQALADAGIVRDQDNVWEWTELLPYVLADSVVFTNANQRDYMLGYCEPPGLAQLVRAKSEIAPHPTLPERFYRISDARLDAPPGVVTVGYFGAFYASRGLAEIIEALRSLEPRTQERLRLYVFTSAPGELESSIAEEGLTDVVVARPYVPYLDFLALTTQFDCLLVNDAATTGNHAVNPYLPSKWSDYAGAGVDVWAVVEPGSILSTMPTAYRSVVGDASAAADVLRRIVVDHLDA